MIEIIFEYLYNKRLAYVHLIELIYVFARYIYFFTQCVFMVLFIIYGSMFFVMSSIMYFVVMLFISVWKERNIEFYYTVKLESTDDDVWVYSYSKSGVFSSVTIPFVELSDFKKKLDGCTLRGYFLSQRGKQSRYIKSVYVSDIPEEYDTFIASIEEFYKEE